MNSDRIGLTKKVTVGICGDAKLVAQQLLSKLSNTAGNFTDQTPTDDLYLKLYGIAGWIERGVAS